MTTIIRPELSKRNEYYIPKHRYYELKHFCMQYPDYKRELQELVILQQKSGSPDKYKTGNPTEKLALKRLLVQEKIDAIKKAASLTDPLIGEYILEAVIEGLSYETMNARKRIPCCKAIYYDLYRKFFYILSSIKN